MIRFSLLALLLTVASCERSKDPPLPEQQRAEAPAPEPGGATATEIRNTGLHVMEGVVLDIENLVGSLSRTREEEPPTFDRPETFSIEVESATVSMKPSSLAALLNRHVFAHPDSPVRNVEVEIEEGKLKQRGVLRKKVDVPFETEGEIRATPEGDILVHTTSLKAGGLPVKGILDFFGVEMSDLIESEKARGLRIDGDDLILDPEEALPPPTVRGKVTSARIEGGTLRLEFGNPREATASATGRERTTNYLFFRGGTLRFGKLTMRDSDLRLVDGDPEDPFDFSLVQYHRQLVAGTSRTTEDHGLVVLMPDFDEIDQGERTQ